MTAQNPSFDGMALPLASTIGVAHNITIHVLSVIGRTAIYIWKLLAYKIQNASVQDTTAMYIADVQNGEAGGKTFPHQVEN